MGDIEDIIESARTIAVVGLSPKEDRPSNVVARYLKEQGYRVIPVNPAIQEIMGERSYPDLPSISHPVDVVDIFRRSEDVLPIVEDAIKIKARAVWMQEGVINHLAAERAREAGLRVVMDKCIKVEHQRLSEEATGS